MTTTSNVLMPKATAVWLIEHTSLTFNQIADFCELHPLEVQGIANEDVAKGIRGVDPIAGGFLSREEIHKGEADNSYQLHALEQKRIDLPQVKKRGARYTPIARRQDRPDAIALAYQLQPRLRVFLEGVVQARGTETIAVAPFLPTAVAGYSAGGFDLNAGGAPIPFGAGTPNFTFLPFNGSIPVGLNLNTGYEMAEHRLVGRVIDKAGFGRDGLSEHVDGIRDRPEHEKG